MSTFALREGFLAGAVLTGLVGAALTCGAAAQQAPLPGFASSEHGWVPIGGDFIQVPGAPRLVANDTSHPYVPNGTGAQPTYRVADLNNPNLKPWVKERMKKANDEVLAGKIGYTPRSSCRPSGVPAFMSFSRFDPVYFVQTPKEVLMIFSGDSQVRHVYLDVPHSPNPKPSWYGESVGHYDGDTLVVDTIGQNTRTFVDNYRTPHSDKLHVTERWKVTDDGNALEVNIKVDDPDAFNEPWSEIQRFRRVDQPAREEVCAENNLQFEYNVPVAETPDF
jgi:hypothetical protein